MIRLTWTRWEIGTRIPLPSMLRRIGRLLEISLIDLTQHAYPDACREYKHIRACATFRPA